MSESNNNNAPEDNDEVDGKSSKPRPRERSPSAMSQSSAGLEWDPSADVGTSVGSMPRAGSSGLHRQGTSSSQRNLCLNDARGLLEVRSSSCNFIFGPSFDSSGRKIVASSNQPSSRSSHLANNPGNAYSTPSASPVPLSLDYSPVAPEVSSGAERRRSQENLDHRSRNPRLVSSPKAEDSSESNNNNDKSTESRRTPSRVVSEASTDWEYGSDKNAAGRSKYVPDWQTNGITRSEIEYRSRKKSGSSTSAASSIFLLQVEAHMKNQSQGSANENPKRAGADKLKDSDSFPRSSSTTDSSDLHQRKMQIAKKRSSNPIESSSTHREGLGASSGSDPSSMCMIVKNFMKILDENPGKERVKYDVLKTHRDYHMAKVYKQISKLEKLNQALLAYKRRPKERYERVESSHHPKSRSDLGRAEELHHRPKERKEMASVSHHVGERREPETSQYTRGEENRPLQSRNRRGDGPLDRGYASDPSTYVLDKISKLSLKPIQDSSKKRERVEPRTNSISEDEMNNENMKVFKPVSSNYQNMELPGKSAAEKIVSKPERKQSIGFYLPLSGEFVDEVVEEEVVEGRKFQVQGLKTIQECLKELNPQCYHNIKERDDFLIAIKRERQVHNETVLRDALESDMDAEEIDKFLQRNYRYVGIDEKHRLKVFWESYKQSQRIKENKENVQNSGVPRKPYIISSKEMRERTQRLRMNDHVVNMKQKKEAEERRKRASRNLQKMFSTNLRQFQRTGSVNIPDRLKLAPLPRPR